MSRKPVIGLTADVKHIEPHPYHCVGDKYLRAVADCAGGTPVVLPALASADLEDWLALLDGVVLTGSYANVHPRHYGGAAPDPDSPLDEARDAANLRLIPMLLERGVPVLGVCRGFQEMNVALGGTLHQKVHEVPGLADHREDSGAPLDVQYGLAHEVQLSPDGVLYGLADGPVQRVNTVHHQGVDVLAPGLRVEATSPDGLVEAFSVESARNFAVAVQWHPEWKPAQTPFYLALWQAFGEACRRYGAARRHTERVA